MAATTCRLSTAQRLAANQQHAESAKKFITAPAQEETASFASRKGRFRSKALKGISVSSIAHHGMASLKEELSSGGNRLREFKLYKEEMQGPAHAAPIVNKTVSMPLDYFDHLQILARQSEQVINPRAQTFQANQRRVDTVLDSMVLINERKMFKYERDKTVSMIMQRGKHRLTDIKHNKVLPDKGQAVTVKDQPVNEVDTDISLVNVTVKKLNQSINRSRRPDTGLENIIQQQVDRRAVTSQGFRPDVMTSMSSKRTPDLLSTSYLDESSFGRPLAPAIDKTKLEDNEAKIIHELYSAHFGPGSAKS